jgi:GNAT superfamily N-acetyltransferase
VRVVKVTASRRQRYRDGVVALEKLAAYPLGADRFRLDHGADYFAFFDRLGEVHYYAAESEGRVVAVAAGILRRVPLRKGGKPRRAWYLCDLKVHPEHRGRGLPRRLFRRAFFWNYLRCPRGYGISMDPGGGRPNRLPALLGRLRHAPLSFAASLDIYSLDAEAMAAARPLLERHRGPVSFLSLGGQKDLILESTGAPLPLLHAQYGPCGSPGQPQPSAGFQHMFCSVRGSELHAALAAAGFAATASASIVHHGMGESDWSFVLTSDI